MFSVGSIRKHAFLVGAMEMIHLTLQSLCSNYLADNRKKFAFHVFDSVIARGRKSEHTFGTSKAKQSPHLKCFRGFPAVKTK